MLIRLISHPTENQLHMDKLIYLKGLPEKMLFDVHKDGRRFLKEPFRLDPIENIPRSVRAEFAPEKVSIHTPAFSAPNGDKYPAIDDDLEVFAIQIDYQTGPGETLWKQIERMLDMSTPRDEKLPVPVVVAKNRVESFSLTADDIPRVDFSDKKAPASADEKPLDAKGSDLRCPVCNKTFDRERGIRMHKARTGHRESLAANAR